MSVHDSPPRITGLHGGGDGPLVVLLHGLGGNCGVWAGVTEQLAGRRWLALDLPGHGHSDPLPRYGYLEVAAAVDAALPPDEVPVVLGHSFGGAVGLVLAGMRPLEAVVSVGLRAVWPEDFVQTLRTLGDKPLRWFDTRDDAARFLLHVNALTALVDPDGDFVERGLRTLDGRWAVATDPRAYALAAPEPVAWLDAAPGTAVTMAHGAQDVMIAPGDYDCFAGRADVVVLPGLGHNAHAEDPQAVTALLPR